MIADRMLRSQTRAVIAAVGAVWSPVFVDRRPADRLLAEFLKRHPEFGGRDRRLIGDVVYGLLRWWGWLEPLAGPLIGATDPQTDEHLAGWARVFLKVAVLEQADAHPVHAWWRAQGCTPGPSTAETFPSERLVPAWVPAEIESPRPIPELIDWLQRRPPLWLRVQSGDPAAAQRELQAAGLAATFDSRVPGAVSLGRARVNLRTLPAYAEGRVEVQDISSQAVGLVCGARPGESWWDACAGGGGKALILAQAVGMQGRVLATDLRADALQELVQRARRAGMHQIETRAGGMEAAASRSSFDGVLVDAPCSGSGTWRRNPWMRWQTELDTLRRFTARQLDLLQQAAPHVKPGGVLVYATCSLFAVENVRVVETFLSGNTQFSRDGFADPFTGERLDGLHQFWPWDGDGDAMFVARLRRQA